MIPPFNDDGVLPPGIHPSRLLEIDVIFGRGSEVRRAQMESVRWMVDLAGQAGASRIILNGSFVTDIMEPNDVDCVLLFAAGVSRNKSAVKQLRAGLPFLSIALVDQVDFDEMVNDFFARDRMGTPKGMVEVIK